MLPIRGIPRQRSRRGLTLIEAVISMAIIAMALVPTITTIQTARVRARSVGVNLIGENLCVAMMELIKRSGYDEVAYGRELPAILDAQNVPSPLLDFPRTGGGQSADGEDIPVGAPGGANAGTVEAFLSAARNGTGNMTSSVLTNDANYYFFSPDQIAAMNGYASAAAVPADKTLLNPQFAWGVYISTDPAGNAGGAVGYPIKRIAVIVKWMDPRTNKRQFTVLESCISLVAPRM